MEQANISRGEVIMAGLGGMGVLVAGHVLAETAFQQYEHVSYTPSYGFAKRGGLCQCTIIFSNEKISSPLLDQAQAVVLLDSSQLTTLEPRVRPGGLIIAEKAGLSADRGREDYKLYALPGMEIAVSMGSTVINNLILLGAYVAITGTVPPELIEGELRRRYEDNEKVLVRNLDAFGRGLELGKTAK
jgi:2-oxoglutarate ferredoxin oxidoreductase subunit gamma